MIRLVCFAVKEEARFFQPKAERIACVTTLVSGMGSSNATAALERELVKFTEPPEFVLTCGFAGGLSPDLPFGTIVYSADSTFPRPSVFSAIEARSSNIQSIDRVLSTPEEKRIFYKKTGADAVDMESDSIRRICAQRSIPSATVRVISDALDEAMPIDFNRFMDANSNLRTAALVVHVISHPTLIPAMVRFQRRTTRAARMLAQALRKILSS